MTTATTPNRVSALLTEPKAENNGKAKAKAKAKAKPAKAKAKPAKAKPAKPAEPAEPKSKPHREAFVVAMNAIWHSPRTADAVFLLRDVLRRRANGEAEETALSAVRRLATSFSVLRDAIEQAEEHACKNVPLALAASYAPDRAVRGMDSVTVGYAVNVSLIERLGWTNKEFRDTRKNTTGTPPKA